MTRNDRLLGIWIDITWAVLPLLVMLSILLDWSQAVQIALTILAGAAVFGTQIALAHRDERRTRRNARQPALAERWRRASRRSRA